LHPEGKKKMFQWPISAEAPIGRLRHFVMAVNLAPIILTEV